MTRTQRLIALLLIGSVALAQTSGTVVYNSLYFEPTAKAWDDKLVALFEQQNPGIKVTHNTIDNEGFKQAIRTYLASNNPPDVLTWSAGNRMRFFASRNLAKPIDDVWQREGWDKAYPKALKQLSQVNGKSYFVPGNLFWFAVYYRKDIFAKQGLKVPQNWAQLLSTCDKLNAAGIVPFTTGSKALWPLASFFDYIDMRLNGPQFHIDLTDGKIPYTDPRVKNVFTTWKQLIDHKCFIPNHASYDWNDAVTPMAQGRAAMYLMGDFVRDAYPKDRVNKELDFFRFPVIDPKQPIGLEAPSDGYFIAASAKNPEAAKKFIAFLGSKAAQELTAKELGRLVARTDVDPKIYANNPFITKGKRTLLATADVVTQYYDRDTDPEMANIGMKGFQRFMLEPDKINDILSELEAARKRIFQ